MRRLPLLLAAAAVLHFGAPAHAAEIIVDGVACTLTEAIVSANADSAGGNGCADGSGADTITLNVDAVLSAADPTSTDADGGRAALPDVTSTLTLRAGAGDAIERDPLLACASEDPTAFRLLNVSAPGALTVEELTLRNGCIAGPPGEGSAGGAVLVRIGGSLTLRGGSLVGNRVRSGPGVDGLAEAGEGGAVAAFGDALLVDGTLFSDNEARGGDATDSAGSAYGGAVSSRSVLAFTVRNARFEGNTATGGACTAVDCFGGSAYGGALRLWGDPEPVLRNTELIANTAQGGDAQAFAGGGNGGAISLFSVFGATLERLVGRDNLVVGGASAIDDGGGGAGGALHVQSATDLLLLDSLFADNTARSLGVAGATGGAIHDFNSNGDIRRTTFAGNTAEGEPADPPVFATGGALYLSSGGPWELRNATFSGNTASGGDNEALGEGGSGAAGAIRASLTEITLVHVTVHGNQAIGGTGPGGGGDGLGGGLYVASDPVTVTNSLLAGNTATTGGASPVASDCRDSGGNDLISDGYNVVVAPEECSFTATGDQTGAGVGDGLLPLADHGCTVRLPDGTCPPTLALSTASLALDGGSCVTSTQNRDQRGVDRPQDHPTATNLDDACDVGAFELDPGGFHTLPPCRVLDTRLVVDAPALAHLVPRGLTLAGRCAIPASASALALNLTVTGATGGGHVVLYPGGSPVPPTSTINFVGGDNRANNAIVPVGPGGTASLDARASLAAGSGTVHLILDVTGYFE